MFFITIIHFSWIAHSFLLNAVVDIKYSILIVLRHAQHYYFVSAQNIWLCASSAVTWADIQIQLVIECAPSSWWDHQTRGAGLM